MEAVWLMEGEHSSFASVAELVKNDSVLAGRILRLANSAFIGMPQKVTSIEQAISLVGFNALRPIILSVTVFDCFSGKLSYARESLVNFWLHSIGVAVTAEILAGKLGFPAPGEAYIAGLLHDLGKLVCFVESPEEFARLCSAIDSQGSYSAKGCLPIDLEKEILGITHVEAGRILADQWGLPQSLGRAIWLHHQPVGETITPENGNLSKLIRFADVLCVTHHVGNSYFLTKGSSTHEHFHFALENMMLHHHLVSAEMDAIMQQVHDRVREIGAVLGVWNEEAYLRSINIAKASLGDMTMAVQQVNRDLVRTNQVLDGVSAMSCRLNTVSSPAEATKHIIDSCLQVFGVRRCLCMIRDEARHLFVGHFFSDDVYHDFTVPIPPSGEFGKYRARKSATDIENEAIQHLKQTSLKLRDGGRLEAGVVDMVAGGQFLASFLVAEQHSALWGNNFLLGEIVADFSGALPCPPSCLPSLARDFKVFSLAAGNGAERLLLALNLARQTEEIAAASRKMEESQRQIFNSHRLATVGRLAAGAAHEINNPLTIISLNIQIVQRLLQQNGGNEQVLERLRVVEEQEGRISKIIQDLMGFARPAQPKLCPSSLAEVIQQVLSVIKDRVSMDAIQVTASIPPDLPLVMVDPLQIEQVFMNLFINANHAMPDGGTLSVTAAVRAEFVEVAVADTGKGILPQNLSKIFDPFFTTKKEGEGIGLGLAICHSIVEHNGGVIRVRSKEGEGTTFIVSLPIDKGSRLKALKEKLDSDRAADRKSGPERCRILIVDDERDINNTLQETLQAIGYDVEGAYDGVEGIDMLRQGKFHLVLLDIRMPRKDGLDVLKFIKTEHPGLKVIMVTGLASKEEIRETVNNGAFACIVKPFRLEKIVETVRKALGDECRPAAGK